ncbi:MAG: hypothetical protein JO279_19180 [Verrucomicrobia bacterium]|nr:hypothetical protein [Verrucomicrobiota bacterium]
MSHWSSLLSPQTKSIKPDNPDGFRKRAAFERRPADQLREIDHSGGARTELAMGVIWFILAAACAALACVLFTILLK